MNVSELSRLESELRVLAQASDILSPTGEVRLNIETQIQSYAHKFLDQLQYLKAYEEDLYPANDLINDHITDKEVPLDEILTLLKKSVDTPGLNPASGGHMGYIPGGGIYTAAWGDYLAAVFNRYAGIYYASPGAVNMEHKMTRWMCALFDMPETAGGTLCSGGSIASLAAVVAARDHKKINSTNIPFTTVYMTQQTHHCIHKALRVAGLGEIIIRYVSVTENDCMDTYILEKMILEDKLKGYLPWLLIGSAGTTDTGIIDPIDSMAQIAQKYNLWFHVDAAYGGFFVLVDELKDRFKGMNQADSIVIDPHKGLFLPYGSGAVLVKDIKHLLQSHYYLANYMQDAYNENQPVNPADLSPELTRHFRGLRMWLPLKLHGLKPFRSALKEKFLLAKYAAYRLNELSVFQLRQFPVLSVVCFRFSYGSIESDNAATKALLQYIVSRGKVFMSSTVLDNKYYIRMAIVCFRTHQDTIDQAIEEIKSFLALTHTSQQT
jgi:aromatic-L-amino-acid/L-tryptophan decarboxylase